MNEKLCIGEIINTHGIKGELKVLPLLDDIKEFYNIKNAYIGETLYNIQSVREHKNFLIIKLNDFNNINEVERFKGKFLELERSDLKDLEEGHYYICDIIGLTVIDEEIGELGKVDEVLQTGSNDVYLLKYKNNPLCVPALADVIKEVNLEKKYIKVKLPKGLI